MPRSIFKPGSRPGIPVPVLLFQRKNTLRQYHHVNLSIKQCPSKKASKYSCFSYSRVTIHSPFGTVTVTCVCPFQMLFEHGQTPLYPGFCMKNPCKNTSNAEAVNSNTLGPIYTISPVRKNLPPVFSTLPRRKLRSGKITAGLRSAPKNYYCVRSPLSISNLGIRRSLCRFSICRRSMRAFFSGSSHSPVRT